MDLYISLYMQYSKAKIITKNRQKIHKYATNINPLKEELTDFFHKIKNQKKPLVGLTEACNAVNIAIDIENKIIQT